FLLAGVTTQAEKAMGEDATPQIVVKLSLDIGRQAGGLGVIRERGEKGLQVLCDHVVEHRAAGIPRCVGGHRWRHTSPRVQVGRDGSARICHLIYCTYVQYSSKMFGWGEEGNKRYAPRCPHGGGSKIPFEIPIHHEVCLWT